MISKGIYIDSKGKQYLITRMNFVYLQNAIAKLKGIEEIQQLNENHDLVKKRIELEEEYRTRPEYVPENPPKFRPSIQPAKKIERKWDLDDDF
jgi:hypothetical protein